VSTVIQRYKNYVGGEWVDPLGDGTIEIVNPATGEVIAETPAGSEADVDRAVRASRVSGLARSCASPT
jgi:acyl-CoA reductase-like NAD-dependent aldehyde dehydrogenase